MPRTALLTGLELPEQTGRGRPKEYINADERMLHVRLNQAERLLDKVAREVGFTPEAERMMRARLFQIGNALNRNKLKRKNPAEQTHALLLVTRSGQHVTVCGYMPRYRNGGHGELVCDCHVTELTDLVDCPDCKAALP